jgi:D-alanyl-D-alanine carboxypeptidase
MLSITLAGLALGVLAALPQTANAGIVDIELAQALQQLVATEGGPPGAIAIVRVGNRTQVFTAGLGDLNNRRRMRPTDHMRIASVAKAFSGAVALSLVERGVLSLDDTVGKWLPELDADWNGVTLAQLLQHTSGVPDLATSEALGRRIVESPRRALPPREIVGYVAGEDLEFPSGSRYEYSNTENFLVALMVEAATGRSYERALGSRVFGPLGLRHTSLPSGYRMPRPYIHGYDVTPGGPTDDDSELAAAGWAWASGGIVSTPLELNRFARAYAGGALFGGATRATQLSTFRPGNSHPPGPGENSVGLGIFRYATACGTMYGHTGNIFGYTQFMAGSEDGTRAVVVSANQQMNEDDKADIYDIMAAANELAVCAAFASDF